MISADAGSREPAVRLQTTANDWMNLLVTVGSGALSDTQGDPLVLGRAIVEKTKSYFPSAPSEGTIDQFESGIVEWVREYRRSAGAARADILRGANLRDESEAIQGNGNA